MILSIMPRLARSRERYQALREKAKELAGLMIESCPDSRESSLALTNLEQAAFWANASIARNEVP